MVDMYETALAHKQDPVRATLNNLDYATRDEIEAVRESFMGTGCRYNWPGLVHALCHVVGACILYLLH
jgi:hypothetical protein